MTLLPAFDEIADDEDQLDWNRERDGKMKDAASDDEPETIPFSLEEE